MEQSPVTPVREQVWIQVHNQSYDQVWHQVRSHVFFYIQDEVLYEVRKIVMDKMYDSRS